MAERLVFLSRGIGRRASVFLSRYLEPPVVRFVAIAFIVMAFINLIVTCLTSRGGLTIFGTFTGGDYAAFYAGGAILNRHPGRLYDLAFENRVLHSILPKIPAAASLPFVHPPFFALPFRLLALLPYMASFLLWVAISVALYAGGVAMLGKEAHFLPDDAAKVGFLLALSFEPFLLETTLGGQVSAFGFIAVVLALCLERRGRSLLSGLALGLCFYKPTFLLLIVPMLVVARQGRVLLGMFLSGLVLAGLSVLAVGWGGCVGYLHFLRVLAHATWGATDVFRTFKFVDILSFSRLLFGSITPAAWTGILAVSCVLIGLLSRCWWKYELLDRGGRDLTWACTLTLTTVINLHFAIYDVVLIVPAILFTANYLYARASTGSAALPPLFRALVVLLYLSPYISQHLARLFGLQVLSVILAAAGIYQLMLASRALTGIRKPEFSAERFFER